MQTIPQIYNKYKEKCIQKNIKPFSLSLFREKVSSQALIIESKIKYYSKDFDALEYLVANNLHFRIYVAKAKTGSQKRVTYSKIAKLCHISREVLRQKLDWNSQLKKQVDIAISKDSLANINIIKKLAKLTILKIKKKLIQQFINNHEASSDPIQN